MCYYKYNSDKWGNKNKSLYNTIKVTEKEL